MKKKSKKDIQNELRIKWAIKNCTPHFAPTISPAPKSLERNEIESIHGAVDYYKQKGVTKLVVQPKFMGSYCDIELHSNIEETRFFSRNGYLITHLDREKMIEALRPIHKRFTKLYPEYRKILLQSELMPWVVMGKGLVEHDFKEYVTSVKGHVEFLKQSSIHSKISQIRETQSYKDFIEDKKVMDRKSLHEKYKHLLKQYDGVESFYTIDLDSYSNGIDIFNQQLEIYGKEGEFKFNVFNVLKGYHMNGSEISFVSNLESYRNFNIDNPDCLYFDSEVDNVEVIYKYFSDKVSENMEGIMIKPEFCNLTDLPPAFKVRNNDYLVMIYGVNFRKDYEYYLRKRKVDFKIKSSTNQFRVARQILSLTDSEITNNSDKIYESLLNKRILEEYREKELDTRL